MSQDQKRATYFHNLISVVGGILSLIWFIVILFLVLLEYWYGEEVNPYLGVITYLILPVFLSLSLLMVLFGAWRERVKRRKGGLVHRFPVIDFNNSRHQKWAFLVWGVLTLFVLFSIFGIYHAYEFTESETFCGRLCHKVMEPEFVAYHHSPHAKISCRQCHIGPGANWYVKSKIAGIYQLYSSVMNRFSRPIPTPIHNLRPAQDTCEKCHWPQKYHGALKSDRRYFLSDEANTQWEVQMSMLVGGGEKYHFSRAEGIHWHMNLSNQVSFITTDEKQQQIPWVSMVTADGKEEIYVDEESGYTAENPPQGKKHTMDCMDCHNRPSHHFRAPFEAVNEAMMSGSIDAVIPYIKREAVRVLSQTYSTQDEAERAIREELENFYQKKYPSFYAQQKGKIEQAIQTVIIIYKTNFFPKMKVSWKQYPNNIGHFIFPGCFRCHDGRHKTAEGKVIFKDCDTCHTIIGQGRPGYEKTSVKGLEFKHPVDIDEAWKEMACYECHTGDLM